MQYAILSFKGKPSLVFVEVAGGVDVYMNEVSEDVLERRKKLLKVRNVRTIRDAIAGGYSLYGHEVGEYSGDDKKRVDDLISKFTITKP
jgi:hypothetical protein